MLLYPNHYDLDADQILTQKLTNAWARGVSLIRQGASDEEILSTIDTLLAAPEATDVAGAVVMRADAIRACLSPNAADAPHFCVYDTDAPGAESHADIVGTFAALTPSAWRKEQALRRYALRDRMMNHVIRADSPEDLLRKLRGAGI